MGDISETVQEAVEKAGESRLNSFIALLVAITATFMSVCNIKDGNIVQTMSVTQSDMVDTWAQYQAKSTKQHTSASFLDQFQFQQVAVSNLSDEGRKALDDKIAFYKSEVDRYDREKSELKKKAEQLQEDYNEMNVHDDQFDMCEAFISVAIAMAGITALTRKKWLLAVAFGLSSIGVFLGLCGFAKYDFHPEWIAKLLG